MVREGGIEPPTRCRDWILNPARLPVPPLSRHARVAGGRGDRQAATPIPARLPAPSAPSIGNPHGEPRGTRTSNPPMQTDPQGARKDNRNNPSMQDTGAEVEPRGENAKPGMGGGVASRDNGPVRRRLRTECGPNRRGCCSAAAVQGRLALKLPGEYLRCCWEGGGPPGAVDKHGGRSATRGAGGAGLSPPCRR